MRTGVRHTRALPWALEFRPFGAACPEPRRGAILQPRATPWCVLWCVLEQGLELLAELGHLRCDHRLAVRLARVLPEVVLVVVLGPVERLQRHHLRHDGGVPDAR